MISFDHSFLKSLGIVDWGTTSDLSPQSFDKFSTWVEAKKHGELNYLADERKEKRLSLANVLPGTNSAIVFLFSYKDVYFHYKKKFEKTDHRMASYALAYGDDDYHYEIKNQLDKIIKKLEVEYPKESFKAGIDTWPILERDLAFRAGLGWFGKNSMLINKKEGSLFFIATILTSKSIDSKNTPDVDHCGNCTACITACPTLAIDPTTRTIEANKCISTFSIELFKEATAPVGMENGNGEIFGCDICQAVCPWNIKLENNLEAFVPEKSRIFEFFINRPLKEVFEELSAWSNRRFVKEFKGTAIERTGRKGLLKNLKFYLK